MIVRSLASLALMVTTLIVGATAGYYNKVTGTHLSFGYSTTFGGPSISTKFINPENGLVPVEINYNYDLKGSKVAVSLFRSHWYGRGTKISEQEVELGVLAEPAPDRAGYWTEDADGYFWTVIKMPVSGIPDGDYSVRVVGVDGLAAAERLVAKSSFKFLNFGVPPLLHPRYQIVDSVDIGFGSISVNPSAAYHGRTIYYTVQEAVHSRVERPAQSGHVYKNGDQLLIPIFQLDEDKEYYVELYIRPFRRLFMKRIVYRTGVFKRSDFMQKQPRLEQQENAAGVDSDAEEDE